MRERECESGITLEYLTGLHAAYEEFISEIARQIPVIKVNYSQFRTADEMAEKIAEERAIKGRRFVMENPKGSRAWRKLLIRTVRTLCTCTRKD